MYKRTILIPLFLCNLLLHSQVDEKTISFFYGSVGMNSPQHRDYITSTYFEEFVGHLSTTQFRYKTPGLGLGYLYNIKMFVVKTDLSYSWGVKKLKYLNYYNTTDQKYEDQKDFSFPEPGESYYYVRTQFEGLVRIHNLDVNLELGIKLKRQWVLLAGIRLNRLLYYSVKGDFLRETDEYLWRGWSMPHIHQASTYNLYVDKEAKSAMGKPEKNLYYLCGGINKLFTINNRSCFAELNYEMMLSNSDKVPPVDFFSLKVGMSLSKNK